MKKLIAQYHTPLVRFFTRHSQNTWDAEDLTQEVFCKILKCRDKQADQYPESHLYTIAWSVLRDRTRRDKVRRRDKHVAFDESRANQRTASVEDILESEQQYRRFLKSLQQLSPKTRNVFLLSRYEGLTYAQIAEHCGISLSGVDKHMIKALKHMKEALEWP